MVILLGVLLFTLPQASVPGRQPILMVIVAAFAVANVLFHRVMPDAVDGPVQYGKEDKALVVSLTMVLLLTCYLYVLPEDFGKLAYLYLVPLFASALVLNETAVLGEVGFTLVALLFLRAASLTDGPYFDQEFALRLVIFSTASLCLVLVTRNLRQASMRTDALSHELSRRLDQIQVINMLVRQSEFTSQLDVLASRTGGIIADAIDTERHAVYLVESDGKGLTRVGEAGGSDYYDRELMAVEENLQVLRGVLEMGSSRVFGGEEGGIERFIGNSRIRNMLVVPLKVRDANIGLLCLVNRRKERYADEDVRYCELLAGFVATLLNSALLFRKTLEERQTVERMAKLMVGREVKMREMKGKGAPRSV